MLSSRAVSFVIGIVGACAGVVAVALSSPIVGLAAGVLALGAGLVAMLSKDDSTETDERLALAEAQADDARSELADTAARLDAAVTRVDELERTLAEAERTPADDNGLATLTDSDSQLFSEAYFRVALDARIASARRHLRPVAVALIDVYEGLAGSGAAPAPPARAAESIRETVRDADTACRLSDGIYAIILEDTPENGAVWTVERVRRNLVSRFGSHTMWAGVACYPAHAFSTDELLEQARLALTSAREWKQDRIEVAIAE